MKTMRLTMAAMVVILAVATFVQAAPSPSPQDDSATVSLTVPRWVDVVADDITGPWGQGHDTLGNPGALNAEDPEFLGGATSNVWLDLENMPYADGALARSPLHIRANCQWAVKVLNASLALSLTSGSGPALPGFAQIGVRQNDGTVMLTADTDSTGTVPTGPNEAPGYYLYALVARHGLADTAGTYTGTTTVQIYRKGFYLP